MKICGKNIFCIILIGIFASSCLNKRIPSSPIAKDSLRESIDMAIARVKPSLIRIHVVTVNYFAGREVRHESSGSGVIISKDGYAVTNHHVAGKAKQIICTLSDKEEIPAKLIGTDPLTDISVIKLENTGKKEFPEAKFGDSSLIKVGDYVLAMGSPLALSQSVTLGIISNTEMVMPELFWPFNRFTLDGEDVGTLIRWIGHDAAIYGGNSGGPLVNLKGEIIGINEIGFGLSGAIPGNIAREVAEELIASGEVKRAWIGIIVQPALKSSGSEKGILVSSIIENSPAETAGFQPGDILIRIAGQEVSARFVEQLPVLNQIISKLPIGEKQEATVLRNGETKTLSVTPVKRENIQPKSIELKEWGMTASNISFLMAKEMKIKSPNGVIVKNTREGGACAEAKPFIKDGDIITSVENIPVKNIDDLIKITSELSTGKTTLVPVLVSFKRKTEEYITIVNLGIRNLEDPGRESQKAWLAVGFQVLSREAAQVFGLEKISGIRITQVYPDSNAEKAGLKTGDIILSLDNEPLPVTPPEDTETFKTLIRQYKIGSIVKLGIMRDKEKKDIEVELATSPKLDREMKKYRDENFEFTARDISFFDQAKELDDKKPKGVLITGVDEGGWAALGHLAVNDLLLTVNDLEVTNVNELEKVMKRIEKEKSKYVKLKILRGIYFHFIEIEPDWNILTLKK